MTRRNLIESIGVALAGAALCTAAPQGQADNWITIADGEINRNGRKYPWEALGQMVEKIPGSMIAVNDATLSDATMMPTLEQVRGIATAARIQKGTVQVKVRWFSGHEVPHGKFLTPSGFGNGVKDGEIYGYRFTTLAISSESAFESATPITR